MGDPNGKRKGGGPWKTYKGVGVEGSKKDGKSRNQGTMEGGKAEREVLFSYHYEELKGKSGGHSWGEQKRGYRRSIRGYSRKTKQKENGGNSGGGEGNCVSGKHEKKRGRERRTN